MAKGARMKPTSADSWGARPAPAPPRRRGWPCSAAWGHLPATACHSAALRAADSGRFTSLSYFIVGFSVISLMLCILNACRCDSLAPSCDLSYQVLYYFQLLLRVQGCPWPSHVASDSRGGGHAWGCVAGTRSGGTCGRDSPELAGRAHTHRRHSCTELTTV